jgi:hypothetical protein
MVEFHVVSGLKAKQEEIRRRISELEKQIQTCRGDLRTILEALSIFGKPERYAKGDRLFGRGESSKTILDALRQTALRRQRS